MNKKGFTLIELLAVIIILGILMIIAIPSVTKYINDSRKSAYVDTAKEIISGARNLVNDGKLEMFDTDTTYYIDQECIGTENASKSPYGDFTKAYVVVTYNGKGYDYYWTSVDDAGQGISKITKLEKLDTDSIESDLTGNDIPDSLGIDGRSKYMIIDKEQTNCGKGVATGVTGDVSGETGTRVVIYPEGKTRSTVVMGDIIKIGSEEFYVVERIGNNLKLLAKYNLKVGNKLDSNYNIIGQFNENDEGYGLQSRDAKSCRNSDNKYNGGITFADTNYWVNKVGDGLEYDGHYCQNSAGDPECAYICDSNCNSYNYIINYANYLRNIGVNIKEARLMNIEEAHKILDSGNIAYTIFSSNLCSWLGSVGSEQYIRVIGPSAAWLFNASYSSLGFGVRPLIII